MKKSLSILLIIILLASSTSVFAATSQPSSWAKDGVSYMLSNGFIPEHLQSNYQNPITRQEFAQLIVYGIERQTYNGLELFVASSSTFKDTQDISVRKAYGHSIISGVGNKMFAPDSLITREQVAAMLFTSAFVYSDFTFIFGDKVVFAKDPVTFTDTSQMSSWAVPYITLCVNSKLLSGVGNNTFNPKGNVTREQAILMLYNLFSRKDINAHVVDELKTQFKGRYFVNGYAFKKFMSDEKPIDLDLLSIKNWTRSDFEEKFGSNFSTFNEYYNHEHGFAVYFNGDKVSSFTLLYLGDSLPFNWSIGGSKELSTFNDSEFSSFRQGTTFFDLPVTLGTQVIDNTTVEFGYNPNDLNSLPVFVNVIF